MSESELELSSEKHYSDKSDRFSETDDSTVSSAKSPDSKLELKECVVNIPRLPERILKEIISNGGRAFACGDVSINETDSSDTEDSLTKLTKDVERLTDFTTLKHPNKRNDKDRSLRYLKKRKTHVGADGTKKSEASSSTSDDSDSLSLSETENVVMDIEDPLQRNALEPEDLQYEILKDLSSGLSSTTTVDSEDFSDSSSSDDKVESSKTEGNRRAGCEEKEGESDKGGVIAKRRKIAEWRRDKLLREKVFSSDSSSSDSDMPKTRSPRKKRRIIMSESEKDTDGERYAEVFFVITTKQLLMLQVHHVLHCKCECMCKYVKRVFIIF